MKKTLLSLLTFLFFILVLIFCKIPNSTYIEEPFSEISSEVLSEDSEEPTQNLNLLKATVLRYVDGDTIWVTVNEEWKIRLIGTVCEESASFDSSQNTEGGELSSSYIKTLISIGDEVYLQQDVSDKDIYNRYLRYVWLDIPEDTTAAEEIESKMLNAIIIRDGYGKAAYYKPDVTNYYIFKQLQLEAKDAKRGLWESYWK